MRGFSLLEILVALFILSFCLLGIAGLQNAALRHTQDAYLRSAAVVQVADMAERTLVCPVSGDEITAWNTANAQLLPQGKGTYKNLKSGNKITLSWQSHFSKVNSVSLEVHSN